MVNPKEKFSFKLILVGDGGVGKTTFVKRHLSGEYVELYRPTIGCVVHELDFETNKGTVLFECWDTAGQEKFGGLRDGYYVGAKCGIVMFDLTFRHSYQNIPIWIRDVYRVCNEIPLTIVGNKYDLMDPAEEEDRVTAFKRKYGNKYVEISARRNRNYEKPFLFLIKDLLKSRNVRFVKQIALVPPDLDYEDLPRESVLKLLEEANKIPIPEY